MIVSNTLETRFQDSYAKGQKAATPVKLEAGKTLGFMVAYCDSDNGPSRECFWDNPVGRLNPVLGNTHSEELL